MLRKLPDIIAVVCFPLTFLFARPGYETLCEVLCGIVLGRMMTHLLLEEGETSLGVRSAIIVIVLIILFIHARLLGWELIIAVAAVLLPLNLAWDRVIVPRYS